MSVGHHVRGLVGSVPDHEALVAGAHVVQNAVFLGLGGLEFEDRVRDLDALFVNGHDDGAALARSARRCR